MNIQTNSTEMQAFIANLYKDGKKPCESFGMSWESLSKLEEQVPELTCKTLEKNNKTA